MIVICRLKRKYANRKCSCLMLMLILVFGDSFIAFKPSSICNVNLFNVLAASRIASSDLWSLQTKGQPDYLHFFLSLRSFLWKFFELYFKLTALTVLVLDSYDNSPISSMAGSDPPTTNYPGKIPSGIDLPSDIANDNHLENESSNS